jgi:hypothetical protein
MAKAAFNNKKTLLTSKLDLNLSKKLVKCYIWSVALCGAETWTLGKVPARRRDLYLTTHNTHKRQTSMP